MKGDVNIIYIHEFQHFDTDISQQYNEYDYNKYNYLIQLGMGEELYYFALAVREKRCNHTTQSVKNLYKKVIQEFHRTLCIQFSLSNKNIRYHAILQAVRLLKITQMFNEDDYIINNNDIYELKRIYNTLKFINSAMRVIEVTEQIIPSKFEVLNKIIKYKYAYNKLEKKVTRYNKAYAKICEKKLLLKLKTPV